ncbi:MAG: excinuclease ABC subunit UvrC [Crocinitomicaceae bacterium]|jgi:excinuclease ABC subunit C|nr:excinuclease ABC subunit UvrC [Crocinitomicaceae bacterium]MCF8409869.1 excinuclease ABC subunit UvrC [Crocinitomicaceae bacterium]MCF8443561.1 excinuclease ABC subunit UvrC [Crocinitomicaceae bacterium]
MSENAIESRIKSLPEFPGVYQYIDATGKIIYVGKAKNLKKRVSSYFNKNHDNTKTVILVKQIQDIRFIVVETELDALILENNLIKEYQPKYNIQLKDDKTFPWICIKNEPYPRIFSTRRIIKDGSTYYGPYPDAKVMYILLKLIKELFPLRSCKLDLKESKIKAGKFSVCLEYHIGNCLGPCIQKQSEEDYLESINQVKQLLKGNVIAVKVLLKRRMQESAERYNFERAQVYKEKLNLLEGYQSKSTVVSTSIEALDVFTCLIIETTAYFNYLVIQHGAIIHAYSSEVNCYHDETQAEVIEKMIPKLKELYSSNSKEVLVEEIPLFPDNSYQFSIPQRGDKKQLLELSKRNIFYYQQEKKKRAFLQTPEKKYEDILNQMQQDLKLAEIPIHIECFDNSNFQGTNAVSACVVFKNAKASKADYRHFNVKTVEGPDDFATMKEVVFRRYSRLLNEEKPLPQLIVIDGGKGQLSAALEVLDELNLRGKIAIIGLAKRIEEVFYPGDTKAIILDRRSETLKVLQQLRDEAHRFGITHHRNKRSKSSIHSELDAIPGIGPKTKEKLLKDFKSVTRIKSAEQQELEKSIGLAAAKKILSWRGSLLP